MEESWLPLQSNVLRLDNELKLRLVNLQLLQSRVVRAVQLARPVMVDKLGLL